MTPNMPDQPRRRLKFNFCFHFKLRSYLLEVKHLVQTAMSFQKVCCASATALAITEEFVTRSIPLSERDEIRSESPDEAE